MVEETAEATLEEQEVAATKIQALFRGAKVEAMKQEQVSLVSTRLMLKTFHNIHFVMNILNVKHK